MHMVEGSDQERRAARKVPRGARQYLGPGESVDRATGAPLPDMPTIMEVERRILLVDEQLAEAAEQYGRISELASSAKASWEEHRDLTIVDIVNKGEKGAKDTRVALAKDRISRDGVSGEDLYRTHLVTEAALESKGKYLYALQARLSALQSLYRGLRSASGLG